MRFIISLIFLLLCICSAAQDTTVPVVAPVDTPVVQSPALLQKDTAVAVVAVPSFDSCRNYILTKLLKLNTTAKAELMVEREKTRNGVEWLFYYTIALGLIFGLLKIVYSRYFNDVFRVFFRTSLRINQIREQLVQSGLQSLLFNGYFALTFGLYLYLLMEYFQVPVLLNKQLMIIGISAIIGLMYLGKYLVLQTSGWLFGIKSATKTYMFIVFLINKVIGIIILPFIIAIAFSTTEIAGVAVTLSLAIVAALFLYRFLRAYAPVQAEMKVDRFHFFLFFLAFEVAPILIIYRGLIRFL
jgi:MFS family permease